MDRTHQIIQSLSQLPSAPTQLYKLYRQNLLNSLISTPHTKPSPYKLLIFWTQILHLMEIHNTTNVLEEEYYPS